MEESIFVEETIVYQKDNQLVARIYPNDGYIDTLKSEKDDSVVASDIIVIPENIRIEVNTKLPGYSKIAKVIEQTSPFVKTPTNKIKRVEYIAGYLEKN